MPRKKKQTEETTKLTVSPRRKGTSATVKEAAANKNASKRRPKSALSAAFSPSDEDIRLRAYFISERRHRLDLPGDASSDWLEAKRQLLSETGPR